MSLAAVQFEIEHHFLADGKTRLTLRAGTENPYIDTVSILSARARKSFVHAVLERFPQLETDQVQERVEAIASEYADWAAKQPTGKPTERAAYTPPDGKALLAGMDQVAREQADKILRSPTLLQDLMADIDRMGVVGERKLAATIYLVGVSRLLDEPLAAIIQGPSSTGKSFVVEKICRLFPGEAVIRATSLTPQCLYYLPDGSLAHRWVIAGERSRREDDEQAEATRALREMISAGEISKMLPEKNRDGQIESRIIHQSGPIAFSETTTLSRIFGEDLNRCILLHANETEEQTRAILRAAGADAKADAQPTIRRHWAIQRLLDPLPVEIPFGPELVEKFPCAKTEARRAFGHLLALIRACALLHQFQRSRNAHGAIVAEPADYTLARSLLAEPMAQQLLLQRHKSSS